MLMPGFEHDQRPDLLITGELAFFLTTDNPFNGLRTEIFPACRTAREQRVAHKLTQLGAEPRGCRHRKSLLRPVKYRGWYCSAHRLAQDPFSLVAAYLRVIRGGRKVLHQFVIQKRDTKFDGRRHR